MAHPKHRVSLEDGRKSNLITTGGAGYIPSTDITEFANRFAKLFNYSTSYLRQKLFGPGEGTFINLSDKTVSRIGKDTKNINTILTNDFLEKKSNVVRKRRIL